MACKQVKHFAAIAEWREVSVDCQAKRVSVNKGSHEQQENFRCMIALDQIVHCVKRIINPVYYKCLHDQSR